MPPAFPLFEREGMVAMGLANFTWMCRRLSRQLVLTDFTLPVSANRDLWIFLLGRNTTYIY
jgi:hypothetical protein